MNGPVVSVIIPHYERPELLEHAVSSVVNAAGAVAEIIIVDDNSSDVCWDRVRRLESDRVVVVRRGSGPKGPSRCRNIGVQLARAERVIFLDSDDIMAPWCLDGRLHAAAAQPDADFWVFPVLLFQDAPGDSDVLWNRMEPLTHAATRFAQSDPPWHTSSALWRRSSFDAIGGFNEAVMYGDDADLHMRALLCGQTAVLHPEALPDVFVRRSDAPRITNTLNAVAIESRRVRLREGTRFLTHAGTSDCLRSWQGQYFAEAEFLLFNHPEPARLIAGVLAEWHREFRLPRHVHMIARAYFTVALFSRRRAYFVLRAARRLVMKLLPSEYFPQGRTFQSVVADLSVISEVRRRLGASTALVGVEEATR